MEKLILKIQGMHCASCAATIENKLRKENGIKSVNVNFATEKAYLEIDPAITSIGKVQKVIQNLGYQGFEDVLEKADHHQKIESENIKRLKNIFIFSLILGLPLFYLTMGKMIGLPQPLLSV